jgi:hypothetical protein
VLAAATTATADFTGVALASVLAAIGLFILPAKRQKGKEQLRQKIAAVRSRLSTALRDQFQKEIGRSGERIRESIAPYSRFIRAEGDKLKVVSRELADIGGELAALKARVDGIAA